MVGIECNLCWEDSWAVHIEMAGIRSYLLCLLLRLSFKDCATFLVITVRQTCRFPCASLMLKLRPKILTIMA